MRQPHIDDTNHHSPAGALDALVLAELATVEASPRRARARPADVRGQPLRGAAPTGGESAGIPGAVAPIREAGRTPTERTGEEFDAACLDALGAGVGTVAGADEAASPTELLSTEENAFVERAITFLGGRDTADIILGRIWDRLTEQHPEGFFSAPDGAAGASGGLGRPPATMEGIPAPNAESAP